jgi:hypothetical protein
MRRAITSLIRSFSAFFHAKAMLALAIVLCGLSAIAAQEKPAPEPPIPAPSGKDKPVAPAPDSKPPDLSKEALVFDKLSTRIHEEADGTGTREATVRIRILADAGVKEMAVLAFTYTALNQQMDIGYVRVIKPDGTVVVTPDYNVQDLPADVTRAAPMYSDIHQKHVAVKGLGVGDTLEYQTTLRTLKPEVPGHFWFEYTFEKNLIILDEQLDLDVPADKAVTVASGDIQPTISSVTSRKHYHWASTNLARPDPDAPPKSVKHWKPSVQVTTFASWEQVGAWYQSLEKESLTVTPAIQAKVAALTKGLTSDDEKIQAIFNDVALHIHYVGLEFGIGRYQPHPADDVLSNEYGDCKDKHTLLATELKAAGIQAWPVLISDGRELDPAIPSPAQFDHVITLVSLGGKPLWMDSTAEVAPVGVLMGVLRDKQALAIPDSKPAYLERTPVDMPVPRSARIEVEGKLSDHGQFTGHISQTSDGDIGALFRSAFRRVPQSQWKDLVQNVAGSEGYAGEVSNPQVSEVEKINQPFQFSFDYTREKYYQWDDKETSHWISAPLPPMGGELAPGAKEKKPADDPDLGYTGKTVYHATLQLPKGWFMEAPKETDLKEDWLEYHAKYSFKDGVFTADRVALVKMSQVPLDQWDKYLAFRRAMFDDLNHQVIISPLDATSAQGWQSKMASVIARQLNEPSLPELMQPLSDAAAILDATPTQGAEGAAKATALAHKGLDIIEAKTVEASAGEIHSLYWSSVLAYSWYMLGRSALEGKDLPTAENYLRAAWRLSQDRVSGYEYGRLLEAKGNKNGAAHQYELAHATSVSNAFLGFLVPGSAVEDQIAESYKRVTGRPLISSALNKGQYDGSLRAELDKEVEIHELVRTTKLNGQGLFSVAFQSGRPVKAYLLSGDKGMDSLVPVLQSHAYAAFLPTGSKAQLLREVRVICTQYAGCDAYILLPSSVQMPAMTFRRDITPANAPKGTKTVEIEVAPPQ